MKRFWLSSPLLLVFLVCGGRDFLKFRPGILRAIESGLDLEAVVCEAGREAAVVFTGAGSFSQEEITGNRFYILGRNHAYKKHF